MDSYLIRLLLVTTLVCTFLEAKTNTKVRNARDFELRRLEKHKFKGLMEKRSNKLVAMTDKAEFMRELNPIMTVRVPGTEEHAEVRQHLVNHMTNLGWTVEQDGFDADTPLGRKHFTNVIATQDPSLPRRLTFACHYDSKYYRDITFIGMTDSAVPCAMLLDLGRNLNDLLKKPRDSETSDISLQFIFFDGEEAFVRWSETDSLYGAKHLANLMESKINTLQRELIDVSDLQRMNALILLDLIGAKNPEFKNWFHETRHLFERMQKIEKKLFNRKQNRYFKGDVLGYSGIEDDHKPFQQKSVPILHLISYPFPKVWHTKNDNEAAFDWDSVKEINEILRVFTAEYLHLQP